MLKYTDGNRTGIIEFKSQKKIIADHHRKTDEQLKAFKQRIQDIQNTNKTTNKEKSLV